MNAPHDVVMIVFVFLMGCCIGSFLNVCAYRIPREIALAAPRSFCPACGADISWRFNIPVVSWFLLLGKARCCGARFSFRYPLIELLTGAMFVACIDRYGLQLGAVYCLFISLLIVGMCTDFDHLMIPDRITLGGFVIGLACSVALPDIHAQTSRWESFNWSLIGGVTGAGILWAIATIGTNFLKKEAMGMGDVKLMACIGAFLGWKATLFSIAAGSIFGSILGVACLIIHKKKLGSHMAIPFGPPLMLAAVIWIFGGEDVWDSYFNMFEPPAP